MCTDRSKQNGIALASTLLATMLLLTLAGAFLNVQRANLQTQSQSENSRQATELGQSGLNYALMRLQADPVWDIPAPPLVTIDTPALKVIERNGCAIGVTPQGTFQISFQDQRYQDDKLPDLYLSQTRPELKSINRLNAPYSSGVQPAHNLRATPPGAANLMIVARSGRTQVQLDVMIAKRYLIDASMLSQADLGIQVNDHFSIQSRDASTNKIRSQARLLIPEAAQIQLNQGSAITPQTILLGHNLSATTTPSLALTLTSPSADLGTNPTQRAQADLISQGRYQPNSSEVVHIPDLAPGDLRQPIATPKTVKGGTYHFTAANKVLYWPDAGHNVNDTASATEYTDFIPDISNAQTLPLKDYRLEIPDDTRVTFQTDTSISGRQPPTMGMGYVDGALTADSLASVQVQGDLKMDGAVVGSGSLITKNLEARGKSQLATTPDLQVTLYAEQKVRLTSAAPPYQAVTSVDWDALHLALQGYDAMNAGDQYSSLDGWMGMIWPTKGLIVGNHDDTDVTQPYLRDADLGAPSLWINKLKSKYPIYGTDTGIQSQVDAAVASWTDGFSYGRYQRVRDFLAQATLDPHQPGLSDKLNLSLLGGDNQVRMTDMMDAMANQAAAAGKTLKDYIGPAVTVNPMEAIDPEGVDFKGLVYAGQDFLADMGGHSFQIEGALVSQGALGILNASRVDSIYNGDYLKSLLSSQANGGTISRMEVVFWNQR